MVNISITKPYTVTKVKKFTDEQIEAWEKRCTCRPQDDAYLCAGCRERNRIKYGDNIPVPGSGIEYGGDEWFKLQEMKDNTDAEGRE